MLSEPCSAWASSRLIPCELVVSPGELDDGQGAPQPRKRAPIQSTESGRECVRLDDPSFQCSSNACSPCALRNAIQICSPAGACAIGSCVTISNPMGQPVEEWFDCNGVTSDGCEVDVLHGSPLGDGAIGNCGTCGATCAAANATLNGCNSGVCVINECAPGFLKCNENMHNGCEPATDAGCD